MTPLSRLITHLDSFGFRRAIAVTATCFYSKRRFSVDEVGSWLNIQREATFVSPSPHTSSYAAIRQSVLDNWAWDYLPQAGDTIFDIGAGIGEEAVVFSELVGDEGRVIAI